MERKLTNKILYLLRGLPGAGKSTWIKNNNFTPYTLSIDKIRDLFPPVIIDGIETRNWDYDKNFFDILISKRMNCQQPIIVDATHATLSNILHYEELAVKYDYEISIVNFNVSLEECIKRDVSRPTYERVGIDTIIDVNKSLQETETEIYKRYTVFDSRFTSYIKRSISDYLEIVNKNKEV